jgi:hypothetical protein
LAAHGALRYAVADKERGVYSSTDLGSTWEYRWDGLRFYEAANIYYRITRDSVYRLHTSTDLGATWLDEGALPVPTTQFPPRLTIAESGDLYCYIRDLVFRRRVGQTTWAVIFNQPNETIKAVHVFQNHIRVLTDRWLKCSLDDGQSFNFASIDVRETLGLSAQADTVICLHRNQGYAVILSRSLNGGLDWESKPAHPDFVHLQVGGKPYYALDFYDNWWISPDGWNAWTMVYPKQGSHPPRSILVQDQKALIATENGVLHQNNGSFRYAWHGLEPESSNPVSHLSMAGDTLLALSDGLAAYSTDHGLAWHRTLTGILPNRIIDLGTHYAGIHGNGLFRAAKGSQFDWKSVPYFAPFVTPFIAFGKSLDTTYASDHIMIYRSTDACASMEATGGVMTGSFGDMKVVSGALLGREDNRIIASTDEGKTWQVRKTFPFSIDIQVSRFLQIGEHLFLSQVQERAIYHSNDGGFNFQKLTIPQDAGPFFQLRVHGNTLLLNTLNPSPSWSAGSLYISTDLGLTWCDIGLPDQPLLINQGLSSYMDNICADVETVFLRAFNGSVWRKTCIGSVSVEAGPGFEQKLVLVPNPATDFTQVELPKGASSVSIYTMTGQIVLQKTITADEQSITLQLNDLVAGLYLIECSTPHSRLLERLVKH